MREKARFGVQGRGGGLPVFKVNESEYPSVEDSLVMLG